jgi:hypothetical protein
MRKFVSLVGKRLLVEAIRDWGVVGYTLTQVDRSNKMLYKLTITRVVEFSSEHIEGYLIKDVEIGVSCGSQRGEEECMLAFGGET